MQIQRLKLENFVPISCSLDKDEVTPNLYILQRPDKPVDEISKEGAKGENTTPET